MHFIENSCYIYNLCKKYMTTIKKLNDIEEHHDPLDSYFECINLCSWVGGEDIECVSRCVEVHLKEGSKQL